jgi:hypothetical protein
MAHRECAAAGQPDQERPEGLGRDHLSELFGVAMDHAPIAVMSIHGRP